MTLAAPPRNSPPPEQVAAFARALTRKGRALLAGAVAPLPRGSTLADHQRARAKGLERLSGADLVLLSQLEAPGGAPALAERIARRKNASAERVTKGETKRARLSLRERLAEIRERAPERDWTEPAAPSRQEINCSAALALARAPNIGEVPTGVSLTLLTEARAIAERVRSQRSEKMADSRVLKRITMQKRLQHCGDIPLPFASGISIMQGEHGAYFSGTMKCGSLWCCPNCAARIAAARQGQVNQLLTRALAAGRGAVFLTLTISHSWGDELKPMREAVGKFFSALWSGRAGVALRKRWGVEGHARTMETTHGLNGWHPHIHAIVTTHGQLTDAEIAELRAELAASWCDKVEAAGLTRPLEAQQHMEAIHSPADAARYIAKHGAAEELTGWATKEGRQGGRTYFQILREYRLYGRKYDKMLCRIYERDIKGARFLTWSRGLKARYAITERTDAEIVAAEESPSTPRIKINLQLWKSIRYIPQLPSLLLDTSETEGGWAIAELLETLPGLRPGSRVLLIFDSEALDRFRHLEPPAPDGGIILRSRSPDCILYEATLLPNERSIAIAPSLAAR
jgi:hypothetical protein